MLFSLPPPFYSSRFMTSCPTIHSKDKKSKRGQHGKNKELMGIKLSKHIYEKRPDSSDLITLGEIASKATSPTKVLAVCILVLSQPFQYTVRLSWMQSAIFTLWEDAIYKCHSLSCYQKKKNQTNLFSVKSEILQHNNKLMCDDHSKFGIQSLT